MKTVAKKGSEHVELKLKYSTEFGVNLDKRIIYLYGELNEDLGSLLRMRYDLIKTWWDEVEKKSFPDITIDISSYGGVVSAIYGALDFYDELKDFNVLVNTKAQGCCLSAATVLLASGTGVRMIYPRCRFMLHDIQVSGYEGTANQVQNSVKTLMGEQLEFFSFYVKAAYRDMPLTKTYLMKEAKKWHKKFAGRAFDHYLTAEQVLELKLVDKIYGK